MTQGSEQVRNVILHGQAASGSRCVMIMMAIDSNADLVAPMKNKTDKEQRLAYLPLLKQLKQAGVGVRKRVLDNECSDKMKELIKSECKLELAPPGCHRRNQAKMESNFSKPTSCQSCPAWVRLSRCISGASCYLKHN